jgi:anti-sigma regulatory factor (Ser/Thr protein kinase)
MSGVGAAEERTSAPGVSAASRFELRCDGAGIADARREAESYRLLACAWVPASALSLVVSELVTNAVRHTPGWWRLILTADAGQLVLEVEDTSPAPPRPRPDGAVRPADTVGGLGLTIVGRLATRLEVEPGAAGKTVRAVWVRE